MIRNIAVLLKHKVKSLLQVSLESHNSVVLILVSTGKTFMCVESI